jgi:hypothetical protein
MIDKKESSLNILSMLMGIDTIFLVWTRDNLLRMQFHFQLWDSSVNEMVGNLSHFSDLLGEKQVANCLIIRSDKCMKL